MTTPAPSLREEHAEQTRARILDAVVDLLGNDLEISVPDVARRSGVSLRTVYRYYPTRDDLLDAACDWIFRTRFGDVPVERTLTELPAVSAALAEQWETQPELARALALSPSSKALVRSRRARRLAEITHAVEQAAPDLPDAERREVAAVLGWVQGIRTWVMLRQDIGLSQRGAVRAIGWALQALIDDVNRRQRAADQTKGGKR
jgi:TetR/AcrR family transcriptional regulator, cholesterol catabolism regulator